MKRGKTKKRITTKRKMRRRILAAMLLGMLIIVFLSSFYIKPSAVTLWREYTILPGDTLWEIARETWGDSVDIRYKIHEIAEENAINPDKLCPGEVILIPIGRVQ